MLRNEPCVFGESFTREWAARTLWQKEGFPDLDYLAKEFGTSINTVHTSKTASGNCLWKC